MSNLASDAFTGTNGAAWGSTWTTGLNPAAGGGTTIQGNAGQLITGNTAGTNSRIARRVNITAPTDAVALFRFQWPGASRGFFQFWIRSTDTALDTQGGYVFELDGTSNVWSLGRNASFSGTQIGTSQTQTQTTGQYYWVRFGIVGSTIRARVWQDGNAEPGTWGIDTTDATITAAGSGAGFSFDSGTNNAVALVDDFSLDTTWPTLNGSVTGTSTASSTITAQRRDSGSVTGTVTGSGTVTAQRRDNGSVTGTSTASSTVTAQRRGNGSVSAAVTATGTVTASATSPLMGTVTGTATASSAITGMVIPPANTGVVGLSTASAVVTAVTGFTFRTPSQKLHPYDMHPLIRRTYLNVGVSIMRFGNSYKSYTDVDPDLMSQADAVYLGGHVYFVSIPEADRLRNAGYGQWLGDIPGSPDEDFEPIDYSQYGVGDYGTGPYGA